MITTVWRCGLECCGWGRQVGGHGEGFDPAIYAANRASNAQTRHEGRLKMSVGSGNILSHPEPKRGAAEG